MNNGHEVCGVVVEACETTRLRPGDHVGVHEVEGCGDCRYCLRGIPTWCKQRRSAVGWRPDGAGGHAEYVKARERWCFRLPPEIPFPVGALITGDGLGVPYHANRSAGTRAGEIVGVFGTGPIGLGNILMQSFIGAEVIAVDVNPVRLELAKACGAALTLDASRVDVEAAVLEYTRGAGVDKAFECSGTQQALLQAMRVVRPGGCVVCIGEQGDVPIHISEHLIRRDITLRGSWFYHFNEIPDILAAYQRGLAVERLITNILPLSKAQEAFDRFFSGLEGKVILAPTRGG